MGKRSRSRSSSDDSSSPDEERRRREKKSKHKHKKDKDKKDKKSKHKHRRRSRSPADGRLAAAKAYLKQVLSQGGGGEAAAAAAAAVFAAEQAAGAGAKGGGAAAAKAQRQRQRRAPKPRPPGVPELAADDFFSRAAEFTAWLQEQGQYFNELDRDESRARFDEFVEDWNGGHLARKFYEGMVLAPTKRTTHNWGLATKTGVAGGGGVAAMAADQQQRQHEARAMSRQAEGQERRRWRADQKELVDELLPKATGREAQVEKRIARREAARAREDSPELVRVTGGGDVMGGGDSFAAAKAREAAYQARRGQRGMAQREELAAKVSAAAAAEAEKMAMFRALLKAGPISIPKRQPPPHG